MLFVNAPLYHRFWDCGEETATFVLIYCALEVYNNDMPVKQLLSTEAQIKSAVQEAEDEFARTGKKYDGRKLLEELREKYVKPI